MGITSTSAYGKAESGYSYTTSTAQRSTAEKAASAAAKAPATDTADKTGKITGRTFGKPKLSEKAAKYYEELKKKFSGMDFVLVSTDKKEIAKANAGSFANASRQVVLIDEEKIERMAEDEEYRQKYESIIANSSTQLSKLKESLAASGAKVQGFGMQVNDNGTTSLFAVLKKSSADQKARIEHKREAAKAEKKAEAKREKKKEAAERLQESREENAGIAEAMFEDGLPPVEDSEVIMGADIDDLIRRVQAFVQNDMVGAVQTEAERTVGQHIDFSV